MMIDVFVRCKDVSVSIFAFRHVITLTSTIYRYRYITRNSNTTCIDSTNPTNQTNFGARHQDLVRRVRVL